MRGVYWTNKDVESNHKIIDWRSVMDIKEIREKLIEEAEAAYFAGGFGGALVEASDIRNMTDEELLRYYASLYK